MNSSTLWSAARLGTSLLVGASALYYAFAALRCLLDVPAESASVSVQSERSVLLQSMVTGSGGVSPTMLAFPLMVAVGLLSCLLLMFGAARGLRTWRDRRSWRSGRRPVLLGCVLGMIVMSVGFTTMSG